MAQHHRGVWQTWRLFANDNKEGAPDFSGPSVIARSLLGKRKDGHHISLEVTEKQKEDIPF